MSLKFCTKCGSKHEYTIEIPKFCSNCGNPFGEVKAAVSKPIAAPAKTPTRRPVEPEIEEDADREVPQITTFEVEIETDASQKIKFGQAKNASSFAREKRTTAFTKEELDASYQELFKKDREAPKE